MLGDSWLPTRLEEAIHKERKDKAGYWNKKGGFKANQVSTEESPIPGLSIQQYEKLMQQLQMDIEPTAPTQSLKPSVNMAGKTLVGINSFNRPWIIDTGATEHITCDQSKLQERFLADQQPVKIPNGTSVPVKGLGSVDLPNGLKINNVLYVPDFHCNILSVSRLKKENNCSITFVASSCVMQDLPSKNLIGKGKCQNGLYLLDPTYDGGIDMKVGTPVATNLWHARLGHTSDTKLFSIGVSTSINKNQNSKVCDSCIRAK